MRLALLWMTDFSTMCFPPPVPSGDSIEKRVSRRTTPAVAAAAVAVREVVNFFLKLAKLVRLYLTLVRRSSAGGCELEYRALSAYGLFHWFCKEGTTLEMNSFSLSFSFSLYSISIYLFLSLSICVSSNFGTCHSSFLIDSWTKRRLDRSSKNRKSDTRLLTKQRNQIFVTVIIIGNDPFASEYKYFS